MLLEVGKERESERKRKERGEGKETGFGASLRGSGTRLAWNFVFFLLRWSA